MNNDRSLKTDAVILRHSDFGEADRILSVYSRQRGKIKVIAKGVRKIRSRKAGHVQPFSHSMLMLARGREFWILTQAELINAFQEVRENLDKTALCAYVIELLDKFAAEDESHLAMFRLLVQTLERISAEEDSFNTVRYYELRLLDYMGFRPQLFQCVRCGSEIMPEDQYFSAREGGVICPRCNFDDSGYRISIQALKYFRHFQRSSFEEAKKAIIPEKVRQEMEALMQNNLTYNLERGLKTPGFIRSVKKKTT